MHFTIFLLNALTCLPESTIINGLMDQVLSFLFQAVTFLKKCFERFGADKIDQLTNRAVCLLKSLEFLHSQAHLSFQIW